MPSPQTFSVLLLPIFEKEIKGKPQCTLESPLTENAVNLVKRKVLRRYCGTLPIEIVSKLLEHPRLSQPI